MQDTIVSLGAFLEGHDGAITAVATVFLMLITGGLVWVGYRQIMTVRAQLRAYVLPDAASIFDGMAFHPPQPQHTNEPGIALNIKNSGQTPAYNIVSWVQIAVINVTDEHTLIIPPMQNFIPPQLELGVVLTNLSGSGVH